MSGPLDLLRRMRSPRDLAASTRCARSTRGARRTFADPRLVQWAGRYATYSGSSPYRAPATLACIPAHRGPVRRLVPAGRARRAARRPGPASAERGGRRRGAGVRGRARSRRPDGSVRGVRDGRRHAAPRRRRRRQRRRRAPLRRPPARRAGADAALRRAPDDRCPGFVVLAGVAARRPGMAHHNVWFPADERAEFRQLVDGGVPADDPTIYACVLVGHRPQPGAARRRELVPARQRPGRRAPSTAPPTEARLLDAAGRPGHRPPRPRLCSRRRSRPPTWPTATGRRAAPSTARRRTAGGPRSCARATAGRAAACTWSAAPATPAAVCRSWRSAPASSPTSSREDGW